MRTGGVLCFRSCWRGGYAGEVRREREREREEDESCTEEGIKCGGFGVMGRYLSREWRILVVEVGCR